jgi:anti-sigma regulatory factor (Ser/Thr protein kinase)
MPVSFRHEALFYAGQDAFLAGTLPFVRAGIEAGEPTLVVVDAPKIDLMRAALDGDADRVHFADMAQVGANPARIIPAWREFVTAHAADGRAVRGIGEPVGPQRGPDELVECHRHEALLNLAFAEARGFWLLCPYDTEALDPADVAGAHHTHPHVVHDGVARASADYRGLETAAAPFAEPLPDPPPAVDGLVFGLDTLPVVRRYAAACAREAGLPPDRAGDLVVAVNEVATNSVRHGGGEGVLRIWRDSDGVICDVRDAGRIDRPLAGRERPIAEQVGGYGLWLANQLCELVQVRSFATGGAVRLHMRF